MVTAAVRPRALIIATTFPPDAAVGTFRTLRLVRHLAREQWSVDVLTVASETYRAGTVVDPQLLERVPAGVRTLRARAVRPIERSVESAKRWLRRGRRRTPSQGPRLAAGPRPAAWRRAASAALALPDREVSWLIPAITAAWRETRGARPDVLYSSGPPFTAHLAAEALAFAMGRPWVADFRDPWARAPWREQRFDFEKRAWSLFERSVMRSADAVVFATPANCREFADHYGPAIARRCHVVPNGCDPEDFAGLTPARPASPFVLLHAGSLYGARNPAPLFCAIQAAIRRGTISRDRFRVRFVGRVGADGFDPDRLIGELELRDVVEFVPHMPRRQVLQAMLDASALLVVQPVTRVSVPGKLYEYLAAGRPVLALADLEGDTAELVRRSGAGVAVPADDKCAIEDALVGMTSGAVSFGAADRAMYDGAVRSAELEAILAVVTGRTAFPTPIRADVGVASAGETQHL